jgi:hypothetical protein
MIVYKYKLERDRYTDVLAPVDAEPIYVNIQGNEPMLWMRLPDKNAPEVRRRFVVIMTGEEYEGNLKHVGSFQVVLVQAYFLGHVFEVLP